MVLLFASLAVAAEPVAVVAALAGKVTALGSGNAVRVLTKGGHVFSGDIVTTESSSRVRLIFSDDGIIFLRPSSKFVIDSYSYSGDAKQDESKFSLLTGGFRAITGAIGHGNKDRVKIATPVATIGIRGTDYVARYCADDCLGLVVGGDVPANGLYTGTNDGMTLIGELLFHAGQYGYTSLDGLTVYLLQPPAILANDTEFMEALEEMGTSPLGIYIPAQPPKTQTVKCR